MTKGLEPRKGVAVEERDEDKRRGSDVDYLAELLAIQQSGPKVSGGCDGHGTTRGVLASAPGSERRDWRSPRRGR